MEMFLRYLRGYVRIRLTGDAPERFLRLCANAGIALFHVTCGEHCCEMSLSIADFRRLRPICHKTFSRVHILEKSGLPFFLFRNRKRKAFFIGPFFCLLFLLFCSGRIWNIHVEGNYSCSTQSILNYLDAQGVAHGVAAGSLSCEEIAASLRENFSEIIWVSAQIRGTRLVITIQENMDSGESQKEEAPSAPCNLTADMDGTIISIITRAGVPQISEGEECQKGDLLVLGRLEITSDDGEIVRYEYVHADADIYVQREYSYYDELSLTCTERAYTGRERRKLCLQVMNYRFLFFLPVHTFAAYDSVCRLKQVRLTENFILPISVGTIADREYTSEEMKRTQEQARALAEENLAKYMSKLSEKVVKILCENVTIKTDDASCVSKGTITVVEKIGLETDVEEVTLREEEEAAQ